jgi:DNA-directed RNA polymerase subunit RPC12/RpoP
MPYVEYDEVEAICSDCGRIFRSEEALAAHRTESHAGLESSSRARATPESHPCPDCGEPFSSTEALRVHRRRSHRG